MARSIGPRFKVARHLGVNVFNHPKALKRGVKERKKLSEFGEQLLEKQILKAYYGMLEKQFKRYVHEALSSNIKSETALIHRLECRLDNIVYRLGFGSTLRQARQMVSHGHIVVNGKKVNIPSFSVKVGDVVSLKESSREIEKFASNFNSGAAIPDYMEKDFASYSGRLKRIPDVDNVPIDVKFSKVIEFYSKY